MNNELNTLPITLKGEHWTVTVIKLNAFTDDIDTPVHKEQYHYFRGQIVEKMEGYIFFLEDQHNGNAYVIITDCPDYEKATLVVRERTVKIDAGSNPVTVIPCKIGECERVCRSKYREGMGKRSLVTMSNTWGDMNGFSRVCEEFVLREIDKAAELGLDIVQIDDGWQMGSTADLSRRVNGRRVFDDDFWPLNEERFPRGMKFVADYAADKGVKVGLWFAPDSRDHFALMERDVAILKNAYDNWGMRFFKLDMFFIESVEDRERFLEYLDAIYAFGDDVAVQIDVTRNLRINYLCGRRYGTIFVENRYTKSISYFPHRTHKNLWLLSNYVPASRLQLEVVNPELNADCYDPEDEFATWRYSADYLFASVMVSNPLFWMELQFLSERSTEELKSIISFWKENRSIFSEGDVAPIGDMPCGRSFTGFYIKHGSDEYALVFREVTGKSVGVFTLPSEATEAKVLLSNTSVSAQVESGILKVDLSADRSYAFIKLN